MSIAEARRISEKLCSKEMSGRRTGTTGGILASQWIAQTLSEVGVEPAGSDEFFQPIPHIGGRNVLGRIRPNAKNSSRSHRKILIGAHFDHLGVIDGETYPGASDNAAAVAALILVSESLVRRKDELEREVVVASFDSEEPPYFLGDQMGSNYFVQSKLMPVREIDLMICLDIVGHALGPAEISDEIRKSVFVLGSEVAEGSERWIPASPDGLFVRKLGAHVIPSLSDYHAFRRERVPFLFFSCGRSRDYHMPSDTPETLDYAKISALSQTLVETVLAASQDSRTHFSYRTDDLDHRSSIETVASLASLSRGRVNGAEQIYRRTQALLEKLGSGDSLSQVEMGMISYLVQTLEEALAKA